MNNEKIQAIATLLLVGPMLIYMTVTFARDIRAMIKAPKGRKIEAYYTSAKGYNPFTGHKGRDLEEL